MYKSTLLENHFFYRCETQNIATTTINENVLQDLVLGLTWCEIRHCEIE